MIDPDTYTYTDKQLKEATQIAYADFGPIYEEMLRKGKGPAISIEDLINEASNKYSEEKLKNIKRLTNGLTDSEKEAWKIVGVYDTNDETGFYGCIIETGNGNAIIAFRGSEGFGFSEAQLKNLQHDWVEADLGLLNSTSTNQYVEARKFMEEYKDVINKYDSVSLTGHSLGGNLAEFSMITCESAGCGSNFERCASFDGPGFSDEFIEHYSYEIKKYAPKVNHYKWSFVGSMLKPPPGENDIFIKVTDKSTDNVLISPFKRHETDSIEFNEKGNVQEGNQDFVAWISEKVTNLVDDLPAPVGNMVSSIVGTALMLGFENADVVVPLLIGIAVTNPGITVSILAIASVVLVIEYFSEKFDIPLAEMLNKFCDYVDIAFGWTKEMFDTFCNEVKKFTDQLKKTYSKRYKQMQSYLAKESVICLHTSDLRDLSDRLWKVNTRLTTLERRIDKLYRKVMWTDLLALINADFKIGSSSRIKKCAVYLNETADRFEVAEKKIIEMIE